MIVGQSPPPDGDERTAPFDLGPSAARLQTLSGLAPAAFRETFATANCLLTWPGSSQDGGILCPIGPARQGAREILAIFARLPLILLGRAVERAFVAEVEAFEGDMPWAQWLVFEPGTRNQDYPRRYGRRRRTIQMAVIPYPSGEERPFDDEGMVSRTETLLRDLVRLGEI